MDTWAAAHWGWGGRGGGEDAGPPAAGLEPAPPYTRFPPSLGLVWTTDSVAGRVSKESEGQVRSWGLDRTKTLGGLPALGPTHEKSSRRVPGRGSGRLGGPAGFEASPISPKLTGARWPRVGPSICWACPSLTRMMQKPLIFASSCVAVPRTERPSLRPRSCSPLSGVASLPPEAKP